jgi:beta-galactosidase
MWPDRTPHPAAFELKHLQAPLGLRICSTPGPGSTAITLEVRNKDWFVDSSWLALSWRVLADGRALAPWAPLRLDGGAAAPQHAAHAALPLGLDSVRAAAPGAIGACLEVRAELAHDAIWGGAGHVVQEAQLALALPPPAAPPPPAPPAAACAPTTRDDDDDDAGGRGFTVLAAADGSASIRFDPFSGSLVSYVAGGRELLAAPLAPCLYRAATDNDRGGSGGTSYAARWVAAGLDRLEVAAGSVEVRASPADAAVECSFTLVPGARTEGSGPGLVEGVGVGEVGGMHWLSEAQPTVMEAPPPAGAAGQGGAAAAEGRVRCSARYALRADGSLAVDWVVDATEALPARLPPGLHRSLPRVGVRFGVPPGLQRVEWLGCGPHECYADRRAGAPERRHAVDAVSALHVPYVFPSESGGRCGVRWAALQDAASGGGVLVAAAGGAALQLSASPFSVAAFDRATHEHELVADAFTHVHLDAAHMGVGGDDSWSPTVHPEFLVPPARYAFSLVLAPVWAGRGEAGEQAESAWRAAQAG